MLIYLLCLVILGIPALVMEFTIGRAAQCSPLHMYKKLQRKGQKWGTFGWICLVGNIALIAFYSVVCAGLSITSQNSWQGNTSSWGLPL